MYHLYSPINKKSLKDVEFADDMLKQRKLNNKQKCCLIKANSWGAELHNNTRRNKVLSINKPPSVQENKICVHTFEPAKQFCYLDSLNEKWQAFGILW